MEQHFGKFLIAAVMVFLLWVVIIAVNTKPRQPGYLISGNFTAPNVKVIWGE